MSFCTNCGNQLPENTAFCPACGQPVGAPDPAPEQKQEQTQYTGQGQVYATSPAQIQLYTTDDVAGKQIEAIGMVTGASILCKNIGKDFGAAFRNIAGGEMKAYTELMIESKNLAINRMIEDAAKAGANAIVAVRFATTSIVQGGAELLAYGTAVKFV